MESIAASAMFQSSTTDEESSFPTPEQKLGHPKAASPGDRFDKALSSGGASSDISLKEGSVFSSSLTSSSDSESESEFYVKRHVLQEVNIDNAGMKHKITELNTKAMDEGSVLEEMKNDMYGHLLEKVAYYKRELEFANQAIRTSEEEVSRLKHDEMKILELQNKIARLEVAVQDSEKSNTLLMHELNRTKERLQSSETEVLELEHKLKTEINKVTHEMQNQIYSANENARALEAELASERRVVSELNFALHVAHENFSSERSNFISDISVIQGKLDQTELRAKLLEDEIRQYELEKMQMRVSLEAQEKRFLADINQLKTEFAQKGEQVDVLNKSLDANMFKYDMLMAEKDELIAKLDTVNAEAICKGIQIQQMETRAIELEAERSKILAGLEDEQKVAKELRLRVVELEKETDMQRAVILDRAEEKREAIRQLCFSIEYYRGEYHELCRAFPGQKRQPVLVP